MKIGEEEISIRGGDDVGNARPKAARDQADGHGRGETVEADCGEANSANERVDDGAGDKLRGLRAPTAETRTPASSRPPL